MIKRILVPIDFSPGSTEALNYAVGLCALSGAELIVLHAIEPVQYATPADLFGAAANLGMLEEEQRRIAERELARAGARLKKKGVKVRTVIGSGTPSRTIVGAARKLKASLIVMGTQGRSGLSHLLMGSVAEKVLRGADCPVLTVRPKRRARSLPAPTRAKAKK